MSIGLPLVAWRHRCATKRLMVFPVAAGSATGARMAPDHLRVATQAKARARARVIKVTGYTVPRSGSQLTTAGDRAGKARNRRSITESSHPGFPRPAKSVATTAVTATQAASMPIAAKRSSPGSRGRSAISRPDADRDVPHHIRPSYADRAT